MEVRKPRMKKCLRDGESVTRVSFDEPAAEITKVGGEMTRKRKALSRDDVEESCARSLASEWKAGRGESEDKDTGGEGVDLISKVGLIGEDFRGGVVERTTIALERFIAVEGGGHAPVGENGYGTFAVSEQQILELDVAVTHALRVCEGNGLKQSVGHGFAVVFGQRTFLYPTKSVAALSEFEVEEPDALAQIEAVVVQ